MNLGDWMCWFRSAGSRAFLGGLFALLLVACDGEGDDGDGGTDCGSRSECAGSCVDTDSDVRHCGTCGNACAEGESCENGECSALRCDDGLEACDGTCVNTKTDTEHCGGCGEACGEGEGCSGGVCGILCDDGLLVCGDDCVDPSSDDQHCGGCNEACIAGFECFEGNCEIICGEDEERCDGICVDPKKDDEHCGACGQTCALGGSCDDGECTCPGEMIVCDEVCTDTMTSMAHCGDCNQTCGEGPNIVSAECDEGTCELVCEDGYGNCDEDPATGCESFFEEDVHNCGACGNDCAALLGVGEAACVAGECTIVACAEGWDDCDGDASNGCEVNVGEDPENCGGCLLSCTFGDKIEDATCEAGVCAIVCEADWADCDGDSETGCEVLIAGDNRNCGGCDQRCDGVCSEMECLDVVTMSTGLNHSCLSTPEKTFCWGENTAHAIIEFPASSSRFLHPFPRSDVGAFLQLSSGENFVCGRTSENKVWCWGQNQQGQIGKGNVFTPSEAHLLDLEEVTWISTNVNQVCAISGGEIWCWGSARSGPSYGPSPEKVTPSDPSLRFTMVAVGEAHNCALGEDKKVYCWGSNDKGQLGTGDTDALETPSAPALGLNDVVQIVAGRQHSCALDEAGKVHCWGGNDKGQLGDGLPIESDSFRSEPGEVVGLQGVTWIATGRQKHTCATTAEETYCWGNNVQGQLGDGTTNDSSSPKVVGGFGPARVLSVGSNHTCAVNAAGVPYCWGFNASGQLGTGNTSRMTSPAPLAPTGIRP